MPVVKDREYRQMALPLATAATGAAKRFDTEYYVEGFATTFDTPYLLYEYEGMQFFEVVDRNALDGADLSDVIMQYDHAGMVYARNKMARSKPPSLLIEPQESGLFIAANLGLTEEARKLYSTINEGLIYKMSWAFRVSEDAYNKETRTRTILKIKKVYDVSAVSYPANADTDISARSWINGAIEAEKREALARKAQLLKLKIMLEV
nr:MAG TPA: prohead serine protease [Caudoviricetes sp.]